MRLELIDTIKFESILQRRIQELYLKLKNQTTFEFDALTNERDMLESILVACPILNTETKVRSMEIAEASHNFRQANCLRKQLK
jgi:hypothetical protein